jgi:hypothetical protein
LCERAILKTVVVAFDGYLGIADTTVRNGRCTDAEPFQQLEPNKIGIPAEFPCIVVLYVSVSPSWGTRPWPGTVTTKVAV